MRLPLPFRVTLLAAVLLAACGGDTTSPADDPDPGDDPGTPVPPPAGQRGTIAYTRGQGEIRLIEPDGSADRLLWSLPDGIDPDASGILGLAWRPDAGELAFSSGHEAAHSLFDRDIYAVRPDGTGLRRLTNPPAREEFDRFPTGTVEVTVSNPVGNAGLPEASGTFFIYLVGAPDPQVITIAPGESQTLTFTGVADFGEVVQAAVAINPPYRWLSPGVDVRANAEVTAPDFEIVNGVRDLAAFVPGWRSDGSRIGYLVGCAILQQIRSDARAGAPSFTNLGGVEQATGACSWHWGPAGAADQLIHSGGVDDRQSIYQVSEAGGGRVRLAEFGSDMVLGVQWLPDASGFLFGKADAFLSSANLFRYDFGSGEITQLTQLSGEFVRSFSVSPDGASVVFERADKLFDFEFEPPARTDLWVMEIDGGDLRLLVEDGASPSW